MKVTDLKRDYAKGIRDFTAVDLSEANLRGMELQDINLSGAILRMTNLSGANLSGANFSQAQLNVARLSAANLQKANLREAILNVANLVRANLKSADLREATLIRAEIIRAELSNSDLSKANLGGADLREATLRRATLYRCILNEANLGGAFLTEANLEHASLNGANLSRADLSSADLRNAEIRQANLSRANLSRVNLQGANLRWSDLSGANLRWADLSEANLSGANLVGADLSHANLNNTNLIHANLSQSRLIQADWMGADLTGATLNGAKLHAVSRFGLKTEGLNCHWIDLSPKGDRSEVYRLSPAIAKRFFNETQPTVRITVDASLNYQANLSLASAYYQMAQNYPSFSKPPNLDTNSRRTLITFSVTSNTQLFTIAYLAILPFADHRVTQRNLVQLIQLLRKQDIEVLGVREHQRLLDLDTALETVIDTMNTINLPQPDALPVKAANFFLAPTQTVLTNSDRQSLNIYLNHAFGKPAIHNRNLLQRPSTPKPTPTEQLPPVRTVIAFVKEIFDDLDSVEKL
jgi:uncharacterized protein YjbI with pentapeptide repeats